MLPKGPYNPNETEPKILDFWYKNQFFKPEYDPKTGEVKTTEEMKTDAREPFAIICPPPNSYARAHIGNLSGYSYQDVFARVARMKGKKVLVLPGKDHAAQEAEVIYLRDVLAPQGKKKEDFTREEFYQQCYEYFTGLAKTIQADEKKVGLSADFDRDIFTLDPRIAKTIYGTFMDMFDDGMVYKDVRIVNWSPGMGSVIPDIETDRLEREADLVYIKYPLADDKSKFVVVATTRPETMLGDTAVVVDPTHERYTDLIGKYLELPLTDRKIPIIANGRVDKEFGTGAVKLTPAHSPDDYTMMLEWNYKKDFDRMPANVQAAREQVGEVSYINVVSRESKMVGPSGKYLGMNVLDARTEIVKDLEAMGLIEKTEKITQNVLICDRSKTVIEPIMSSQWFIDVDRLKAPAIEAIKSGKVTIHPESMQNKMLNWLENLRDWPISRSIWWGYQFPVWYKGELTEEINAEGKIVTKIAGEEITDMKDAVEKGLMKVQIDNPGEGWIQDPDVFDTWFSSGQWPFATLTAFDLMDTFFPTDVMEMGYGILELWASRMIMLSLYVTGEVPFKDVYIQGHIKAADGRKMSKSLKNNVNIDELNDKYGIDAVRLFYLVGNKAGADYRIDYEKLEGYRRFLNKIWNASKFVEMNVSNEGVMQVDINNLEINEADLRQETNKKLYKHIVDTHTEVTKLIEGFNIGIASQVLFENFWHVFCDVCLEEAKPHVYTRKDKETGAIISEPDPEAKVETQKMLIWALISYLKMLHPFIPFITEEIWQNIKPEGEKITSLVYSNWDL